MTIAHSQSGASQISANTASRTLGSNVAVGDLVVVALAGYCYLGSNVSPTAGDCAKSGGTATIGSFTLDRYEKVWENSSVTWYGIWSAVVTGAGSLTVTVSVTGGGIYGPVSAMAFTGNWTSDRVEAVNSSQSLTNDQTSIDSGNVTSAGPALFVVCGGFGGGSNVSFSMDGAFTNVYTDGDNANNQAGSIGYRIVTGGTTESGSWTMGTPTDNNVGIIVAYKEGSTALTGSVSFSFGGSPSLTGTGMLSSAVSMTFGGTYGLFGSGPLTSVISLALGSSGIFFGSGSLTGTSTLSFSPAGTLLGIGVLTGSTTLAFTVNPVFSGAVGFFSSFGQWFGGMGYPNPQALQSTIPISASVVGGITGEGPLASSIPISFSVASHQPPGFASLFAPWLGGGLDAGVAEGVASATFSVAGAFLDVPGYLVGSIQVSFSALGAGSTSASAYQGRFRSPLMHPGIGPWHPGTFKRRLKNQTARSIGDMSGLVRLAISSFGSITGFGTLSTAVPSLFTVSGTVVDAGSLSSSIPLLFSASGALSGEGALSSNATLTFNLSGSITDPGAMTGSVPMRFGAAGTSSGEGYLSANVPMLFTVRSSFPNVWRPIETGHGTIWKPIKTR